MSDLLTVTQPVFPGQQLGRCPFGNHYAPVSRTTGRVMNHPASPGSRDGCPGANRLARATGALPGYLLKISRNGPQYVIWDPKKSLPVQVLANRQQALDVGYSAHCVERANRRGSSTRGDHGVWDQVQLRTCYGNLPRRLVGLFCQALRDGAKPRAYSMLVSSEEHAAL